MRISKLIRCSIVVALSFLLTSCFPNASIWLIGGSIQINWSTVPGQEGWDSYNCSDDGLGTFQTQLCDLSEHFFDTTCPTGMAYLDWDDPPEGSEYPTGGRLICTTPMP